MNDEEHRIQKAVVNWANVMAMNVSELLMLNAYPAGGMRNKIVAAKLKAEGVKAGVPDLNLPVARGGYHGLYIEMKTETGRLSDAQKWWLEMLGAQGHRVAVCRSSNQAIDLIEGYLGI